MISFALIVVHVLSDPVPKGRSSDEDHPTETFFFDETDSALAEVAGTGFIARTTLFAGACDPSGRTAISAIRASRCVDGVRL